jgi:hypothetical protein
MLVCFVKRYMVRAGWARTAMKAGEEPGVPACTHHSQASVRHEDMRAVGPAVTTWQLLTGKPDR